MANVKILCAVMLLAGTANADDSQESAEKAKQARRDQLRIAVQEICPVSGQKLGSMGTPVKVALGKEKEEVFLCCKGCAKGKINPKHWATIHTNIAKAQGKCPVMDKALPKNPKWAIVNGRIIYIRCPPCSKKLADTPEPYFEKLDEYYTTSLKAKRAAE
jgi:uncharacterized protein with PIN domain